MEIKEMERFVEEVSKIARRIVKKSGDHLPMVFALIEKKLTYVPVITVGTNPRVAIKAAIESFREIGADWIVVVITARYKTMKPEEIRKYKRGDLQKDVKAKDILMISGYRRDGRQYHKTYEIVEMEECYELDEIELPSNIKGFLVPEPW